MTEYFTIILVAFLGSGLTMFSGFGLGTILVPVFGIFFPIELAIALTAIVHFLNNIFKLLLLGRNADKKVIIRFGIPSIIASLIGAYILTRISNTEPILQYTLYDKIFSVTFVKLIIAALVFVFALFELIPKFKKLEINAKYLPLGGLLSGFFGGLSGNQGVLRSAFLIKTNLSKESFIATGVILACLIDVSRLSIYANQIVLHGRQLNISLIISATLSAFIGVLIGNKLLKKVTIHFVQYVVVTMLFVFSILLSFGII